MIPSPIESRPGGSELRETARLAAPLAVAFAGTQMLSVVDVLVAGHLGERALAAVGLGQSVWFIAAIFPIGVLAGLDPLVSQALGRKDPAAGHRAFAGGMRLAWRLALASMAAMAAVLVVAFRVVDFDAATVDATWGYLLARMPSTWPALVFVAQRSLLQAWGRTGAVAGSMVLANLVNVPASALLGFGDAILLDLGLPAIGLGDGLGATGIGLASTIVSLAQMAYLRRAVRRLPDRPARVPVEQAPMGPVWRLGWPAGLQWAAEVSIFAGMTIVMGVFGETAVGAHQVALNVTSLTFSVCLGVANAAAVRVGMAIGAQDRQRARRAGLVGMGLGVGVMAVSATTLWFHSRSITGLFTDVEAVAGLAAALLLIAAVFQVLDGVQAVTTGALRGAGDTRAAMILGVVGYWLIGFPVGLTLALGFDFGPHGLWYGLVAGLVFSASTLVARMLVVTRGAAPAPG